MFAPSLMVGVVNMYPSKSKTYISTMNKCGPRTHLLFDMDVNKSSIYKWGIPKLSESYAHVIHGST